MTFKLASYGYVFDQTTRIWVREDYAGIAYNDGDEVEQRIAQIVSQANDRSALSAELRAECTDWPTLYHLSPERANLLRPLEPTLKGRVLEIGAGCGALTRYLGECGGTVLALEGSPRRAAIAAARTADLENVTVVSESFDKFNYQEPFDVITLIGVLEYANLFIPGPSPALALLERARSLLAPGGKLIVAIENQLGLKYFAGAPEDHVGLPMYGVEGRYRADQPQTFGRKELTAIVNQAGFAGTQFLVPMPDYKLPVSVLTEAGLNDADFDAAALAWQAVRQDRQLPARPYFSLERTWPQIFDNGLGLDLANSFLLLATPDVQSLVDESNTLAYHYSTQRRATFCKETRFVKTASATIAATYRLLTESVDSVVDEASHYQLTLPDSSPYQKGTLLAKQLINLLSEPGDIVQQFSIFFNDYLGALRQLLKREERDQQAWDLISIHEKIPGRYIDAIPQNLIVDAQGKCSYIDAEWYTSQSLELGYLLFRSIICQIVKVLDFARVREQGTMTRKDFIAQVFKQCDLPITEADFARYIDLECEFQAFAIDIPVSQLKERLLKELAEMPEEDLTKDLAENPPQPVSDAAPLPIFAQRVMQIVQQLGGINSTILRAWTIFKEEGVPGIKRRLNYLRDQSKE